MDPELTEAELEALNKIVDDVVKLNKQLQRLVQRNQPEVAACVAIPEIAACGLDDPCDVEVKPIDSETSSQHLGIMYSSKSNNLIKSELIFASSCEEVEKSDLVVDEYPKEDHDSLEVNTIADQSVVVDSVQTQVTFNHLSSEVSLDFVLNKFEVDEWKETQGFAKSVYAPSCYISKCSPTVCQNASMDYSSYFMMRTNSDSYILVPSMKSDDLSVFLRNMNDFNEVESSLLCRLQLRKGIKGVQWFPYVKFVDGNYVYDKGKIHSYDNEWYVAVVIKVKMDTVTYNLLSATLNKYEMLSYSLPNRKPPLLPPENDLKIDILDDDVAELNKGVDSLSEYFTGLDSHMLSVGQIVVKFGDHVDIIQVMLKPVMVQGYYAEIMVLAKNIDVRLNQKGTKLCYGSATMLVTVEVGSNFVTDNVILTVSLGVLKANLILRELISPEWNTAAISHLSVGNEYKVALRLDNVFWPNWKFLDMVASISYVCGYYLSHQKVTCQLSFVYMVAGFTLHKGTISCLSYIQPPILKVGFFKPPAKPPDDVVLRDVSCCEPNNVWHPLSSHLMSGGCHIYYCSKYWDLGLPLIQRQETLVWTTIRIRASIFMMAIEDSPDSYHIFRLSCSSISLWLSVSRYQRCFSWFYKWISVDGVLRFESEVEKGCEAAGKLVDYGYITGNDTLLKRQVVLHIRTGSQTLDDFFGGVTENEAITETFGGCRSGKKHIGHILCVSTQLPTMRHGGNVKVTYSDTDGINWPNQTILLDKRLSIESATVLDDIIYGRTYKYEHQVHLLLGLAAKVSEDFFGFLEFDFLISLFNIGCTDQGNAVVLEMEELGRLSWSFSFSLLVVNHDSFYCGLTREELERVHEYEIDHPNGVDAEQLECALKLRNGESVQGSIYDFKRRIRSSETFCQMSVVDVIILKRAFIKLKLEAVVIGKGQFPQDSLAPILDLYVVRELAVAAFMMRNELYYLIRAMSNPKKLVATITDGSKVPSNMAMEHSLLLRVNTGDEYAVGQFETAFFILGFSLVDLAFQVCCVNKFYIFSSPRPPEVADLEDKVNFKDGGMLRTGIIGNIKGAFVF